MSTGRTIPKGGGWAEPTSRPAEYEAACRCIDDFGNAQSICHTWTGESSECDPEPCNLEERQCSQHYTGCNNTKHCACSPPTEVTTDNTMTFAQCDEMCRGMEMRLPANADEQAIAASTGCAHNSRKQWVPACDVGSITDSSGGCQSCNIANALSYVESVHADPQTCGVGSCDDGWVPDTLNTECVEVSTTHSGTESLTLSQSLTHSHTDSHSSSVSESITESLTATVSLSDSRSTSVSESITDTLSVSGTVSQTTSQALSLTHTISDHSPTESLTPSISGTKSISGTRTVSSSVTGTDSLSGTQSQSVTESSSMTESTSDTWSTSNSISSTFFTTLSGTHTSSITSTLTSSISGTKSITATLSQSDSDSHSFSNSVSSSKSVSQSSTATLSTSVTPSSSESLTSTSTPTSGPTSEPMLTPTTSQPTSQILADEDLSTTTTSSFDPLLLLLLLLLLLPLCVVIIVLLVRRRHRQQKNRSSSSQLENRHFNVMEHVEEDDNDVLLNAVDAGPGGEAGAVNSDLDLSLSLSVLEVNKEPELGAEETVGRDIGMIGCVNTTGGVKKTAANSDFSADSLDFSLGDDIEISGIDLFDL